MSEVIRDELNDGQNKNVKIVALSGPTHAEEVAQDLPTTIVSACDDLSTAELVQEIFSNTCMRVYTNTDVRGVERSVGHLKTSSLWRPEYQPDSDMATTQKRL